MREHYVYELINHYGTVEYVGETIDPKRRMHQHIKEKPNPGVGTFYGRQDLIMNIVAAFTDRKQAMIYEGTLKNEYNIEWTETTRGIKCSKAVLQYTKSGQLIKKWDSATNAGKVLDIPQNNITQCCKGKHKYVGGYVWKYENN